MTRLEIATQLLSSLSAGLLARPNDTERDFAIGQAFSFAEAILNEEERRKKVEAEVYAKSHPTVWQWPDGSWRRELPTEAKLEEQLSEVQAAPQPSPPGGGWQRLDER